MTTIGKLLANGALLFDVLIIGAGPSGLSTATDHMHNVLGWDHRNPAELRAAGRADISNRYSTIQFQNTSVENISKLDDKELFEAWDSDGKQWYGRKVVLATGVRDIPLDIEGFSECWVNGIYHCLFCDGYEERGQETVGVIALGPVANVQRALHLARMAHRLSRSVTIYTNENQSLATEIINAAPESKSWLNIESRPIARFQKGKVDKTVIVHFKDQAETKEEGFLVYNPKTEINGPFADQLSLPLTEGGDLQTSQPFYETSVSGVFAVGDCATPLKAVSPAIAMGSLVSAGLVAQLQAQPMVGFGSDLEP